MNDEYDNFVGKIKQTPPHKSAVKIAERERTVYRWELVEVGEMTEKEKEVSKIEKNGNNKQSRLQSS